MWFVFSTTFPASLFAPYMEMCSNQLRSLTWFIQPGGSEPRPRQHGWMVALEDWVLPFGEARQVSQTSVSTNTVNQLLSMLVLFINSLYGRMLKNNVILFYTIFITTTVQICSFSSQDSLEGVLNFPHFCRKAVEAVEKPRSLRYLLKIGSWGAAVFNKLQTLPA